MRDADEEITFAFHVDILSMAVESGLSIGLECIGTFDRPANSHLNQLISVCRASIDVRGR